MDDLFAPPVYEWKRLSPSFRSLRRVTTLDQEFHESGKLLHYGAATSRSRRLGNPLARKQEKQEPDHEKPSNTAAANHAPSSCCGSC